MQESATSLQKTSPLGLLLAGHGTKDTEGTTEFMRLASQIAARWTHGPTASGMLEFAVPTIADAVNTLVGRGAEEFLIMPLLLFAAGHAKTDIPAAVADAVANLDSKGTASRQITWRQTGPLECHPKVVQLSQQRYQEAIEQAGQKNSEKIKHGELTTLLVLVGRGSRDPEASAKTHEFAQLRSRLIPDVETTTCFYAMAEPSFDSVLNDIGNQTATNKPTRVVVQPHLLFQGRLIDAIQKKTNAAAQIRPDFDWIFGNHLGPDPALADSVLEICEAAIESKAFHNTP